MQSVSQWRVAGQQQGEDGSLEADPTVFLVGNVERRLITLIYTYIHVHDCVHLGIEVHDSVRK